MIELRHIEGDFSVCKLHEAKDARLDSDFVFVSRTDEEISLVCRTADKPADTAACEDGWAALRIEGTLDFSLVGILSRIAGLLAEEKIPIFAISTYNTDYILFKKEYVEKAYSKLEKSGYSIIR